VQMIVVAKECFIGDTSAALYYRCLL
jgi:hypothetical protein